MGDLKSEKYLVYPSSDSGGTLFFKFEQDFVEDNIRCIPMIVRFKLDACGIKLKLAQWSKFTARERKQLGDQPCVTVEQINAYRLFLQHLIAIRTGLEAT